ncbi:SDR family NAD(P)-dependent oxidoreductase [Variovorax sp. J22P168]|uniref:SDR family NAD(P)-dependent oxidoreductase n=1 Tax=Variovorax jilinensis TaxID=3053513 RepID=UPI0025773E3B|nr:SDR family NAD(P)-dependent oxidoreductase [Variovorax sp. J22P168]MDM0015287.1 SDR family NAD(P)-dependent oxidoreductase [Variovorax sp. J22P168]
MNAQAKVALVTGGARGIGDAIVQGLQGAGSKVFSLDRSAPEHPRDGVAYLEADVSDPVSVAQAFRAIDAAGTGIDTVVHNAGIQRSGLCGQMSFEDWSKVLGTHLNGMFLCATHAIPRMIAQGRGGAIIGIASTAAFVGLPGRGPYTAAKAGIVGLARCLAVETAPHRIRVNAVAPGFTRTAIIEDAVANGSLREDWMLERVPLGRLAEPLEIANAVKYLASDDASYVTGQTLVVDGGWSTQGMHHSPAWLQQAAA